MTGKCRHGGPNFKRKEKTLARLSQTGKGLLLRFQNGPVAAVAGHDLTSCGATAARSPRPACSWHSLGPQRPFTGGRSHRKAGVIRWDSEGIQGVFG